MRYLTIKRHKAFAGSMAKMKVYIEDPMRGELDINGVPCRKLGDLKNGEEKVFEIENYAAKVYVIAGKTSKDWCNDFFQLTDGVENVYLSGKNEVNPASGNAFRFDNNVMNPEVLANRKKGSAKGIIILVVSIIVGSVAGYLIADSFVGNNDKDNTDTTKIQFNIPDDTVTIVKSKDFTYDNMTITLTEKFKETTATGDAAVVFASNEIGVAVIKEPYDTLAGFNLNSAEDYANAVVSGNNYGVDVQSNGNLVWFEMNKTFGTTLQKHRCYAYQSDDAMWLIEFYGPLDSFVNCETSIVSWANSVNFN